MFNIISHSSSLPLNLQSSSAVLQGLVLNINKFFFTPRYWFLFLLKPWGHSFPFLQDRHITLRINTFGTGATWGKVSNARVNSPRRGGGEETLEWVWPLQHTSPPPQASPPPRWTVLITSSQTRLGFPVELSTASDGSSIFHLVFKVGRWEVIGSSLWAPTSMDLYHFRLTSCHQ